MRRPLDRHIHHGPALEPTYQRWAQEGRRERGKDDTSENHEVRTICDVRRPVRYAASCDPAKVSPPVPRLAGSGGRREVRGWSGRRSALPSIRAWAVFAQRTQLPMAAQPEDWAFGGLETDRRRRLTVSEKRPQRPTGEEPLMTKVFQPTGKVNRR